MQRASHENIIKLLGIYLSDDGTSVSIVTRYYPLGDLNKEIRRRQNLRESWSEQELWYLFGQLVSAHAYLEELGIAHKGIKPQYIFLDSERGQTKLIVADLGSTVRCDGERPM